jgi:hypothetical protein
MNELLNKCEVVHIVFERIPPNGNEKARDALAC